MSLAYDKRKKVANVSMGLLFGICITLILNSLFNALHNHTTNTQLREDKCIQIHDVATHQNKRKDGRNTLKINYM